jgi:hypothetical protein
MVHLAKFRKTHPNLHFTEVAKKAKETYHSPQKGGAAMGGDLSPTDFKADSRFPTSGSAAINAVADQYSGGKKSRRSKSSKKSRKSGKKSRRSKSCKRR